MTEMTKKTLINMIVVFNKIRAYQESGIKVSNKTETIGTIMYQYDSEGMISSVYADCCEVGVFYNTKNKIREVMDHHGEFSLYVTYDENDTVTRAFISNCFSRKCIPVTGCDNGETVISINPFSPEFYIFNKDKKLIEVYKDGFNGLTKVSEEAFNTIKETLDNTKYFN